MTLPRTQAWIATVITMTLMVLPLAVNHHIGAHHQAVETQQQCHYREKPQVFENLTGAATVLEADHHHEDHHDHAPHKSEDHDLATAPVKKTDLEFVIPVLALLCELEPLLIDEDVVGYHGLEASTEPRSVDRKPPSSRGPPAPFFI